MELLYIADGKANDVATEKNNAKVHQKIKNITII